MDEVDIPGERFRSPDRELERRDLVAERGAERVECRGGIGILAIALVDEEARGGIGRPRQRNCVLEARLDTGGGIHDQERAIRGVEPGHDLGREI